VMMLSGQPGDPGSLLASGGLTTTLDRLADADHGLAPIVIVPDQLGSTYANPLCVDGKLGNSATYLTVDVPKYVSAHFRVATGRQAWAIGGFSQGATCSIQLASAHPEQFGSFLDVAGELGPSLESREATIEKGFGGSTAAYKAAQPAAILAAHGHYPDTLAFFAIGENDSEYGGAMISNSAAASAAGMTVIRYTSPRSGHDWVTATNGIAVGLGDLYPRLGLAAQPVR
jgi:S-formylglutathione hydrolase FrmB